MIKMVVFDFDGVFTDNRVLVMQDGSEGVICNRSDGFGLRLLKNVGVNCFVLSKEKNPVVKVRCEKLDVPCINGVDDKIEILLKEVKKRNIDLSEVAYLGNDINDVDCLKKVGLPSCVADAHESVKSVCTYMTKAKGGYGAVREFCEYLVNSKKI